MADLCYCEVSHDGVVPANFKMAQPEFVLLVLQRAFHRPTGKADVQDDFQRCSRIGIAKEVFFLARIEDVAGIDEPIRAKNLAVALQPERSTLDLPDGRTFLGVLDVNALPRLAHHGPRIATERFDVSVDRTRFTAGIAQPAVKVAADFTDVALLECFESRQEIGATAVPFVEGEPTEDDAVGQRVADLLQGDLVFWSVDDVVGNGRFLAACGIVPSVFGKEQRAVEHGAKAGIEADVAEVDADDAAIDFARVAAPLPLDAGRFRAGLGMSRIVDDADGLRIGVIAHDELLGAIAE